MEVGGGRPIRAKSRTGLDDDVALSVEQRGLELLARDQHGINDDLRMLGHCFSRMMAGLVRRGLATAARKVMKAGGKTIEITRIRITAARRWTIEG